MTLLSLILWIKEKTSSENRLRFLKYQQDSII
uniref:Uncharacterized protein n=1 Tax=Podoviridae sp. ct8Lf7 TaxID=2827723 RepID=A0A8S5S111_9CAUD|nr:MAG TPA: hypothetical protein [Podoviridae sp. ct8Lf7]